MDDTSAAADTGSVIVAPYRPTFKAIFIFEGLSRILTFFYSLGNFCPFSDPILL